MHTFSLLTDPAELDKYLLPIITTNGSEVPASGSYIAAVEFDEEGAVVAYQMLQDVVFLEGLWARDSSAHLLKLYNMATRHAVEKIKVNRLMTMTRTDTAGQRIGKLAQRLGFDKMNWNFYRRKI